ncbi:unnamed protein product [Adineta steineri]|uniref:Uncharacterized protein n=1 Tax=Adineta steineri TaxID=433720 RepID=A0A815NQI3_9BILA|nr:unnamed protein product [Adineta steineri]CAF4173196.1 unnamed protein product [Adineta steineri]
MIDNKLNPVSTMNSSIEHDEIDYFELKIYSEEFDYVIITTGHYSTLFIRYLKCIETFPGRLLHSHDYRFAEDF